MPALWNYILSQIKTNSIFKMHCQLSILHIYPAAYVALWYVLSLDANASSTLGLLTEKYLQFWEGCIYIQCEAPDDIPPGDQQAFRSPWITVFKNRISGSQNPCVKASHVAQNELSASS